VLTNTFLVSVAVMLAVMLAAALIFPELITPEAPFDLEPSGPAIAESTPTEEVTPEEPTELPVEPPAVVSVAIDGVVFSGEYAHWMDAGGFEVHWSNDLNYLRVGLVSPGTGYVAIGFDPEHRMRGANFIIAAVRTGRLTIRDDYGDGTVRHTADTLLGGTDDIIEAAGREREGRTTVEFVIPLATRDEYDKTLVPGEIYNILVAYHETSDSFTARHSQRGSGTMRLDVGR